MVLDCDSLPQTPALSQATSGKQELSVLITGLMSLKDLAISIITRECGLPPSGFLRLACGSRAQSFHDICEMVTLLQTHLVGVGLSLQTRGRHTPRGLIILLSLPEVVSFQMAS